MKNDENTQLEQLLAEFRAFRDTEWREFRDDVNKWQVDSAQRTATLEAQVKSGVTGNGQPSRLAVVEEKVNELTNSKYKAV